MAAVQGGTFSFIVPTLAILSLDKWRCDYQAHRGKWTNSRWIQILPMTERLLLSKYLKVVSGEN
jgi:hypothetical protein